MKMVPPKSRVFCTQPLKIISWFKQDDEVICLRIKKKSDIDDMQSDYSAGSYFSNIKNAMKYLTE